MWGISNGLKYRNEIKIMKELNNDHIVKLYDSFEDKEFLYMVLEYCNGGIYNLNIKEFLLIKIFYTILQKCKF